MYSPFWKNNKPHQTHKFNFSSLFKIKKKNYNLQNKIKCRKICRRNTISVLSYTLLLYLLDFKRINIIKELFILFQII